jgi:hypothetical protein
MRCVRLTSFEIQTFLLDDSAIESVSLEMTVTVMTSSFDGQLAQVLYGGALQQKHGDGRTERKVRLLCDAFWRGSRYRTSQATAVDTMV